MRCLKRREYADRRRMKRNLEKNWMGWVKHFQVDGTAREKVWKEFPSWLMG